MYLQDEVCEQLGVFLLVGSDLGQGGLAVLDDALQCVLPGLQDHDARLVQLLRVLTAGTISGRCLIKAFAD